MNIPGQQPHQEYQNYRVAEERTVEDYFHSVITADEQPILQTAAWSGLLRLDTEASAQMFYAIHGRLQEIVNDKSGING